jgi:predicted O-linked N-acetylglucosamine transferase (SPINDLY family)
MDTHETQQTGSTPGEAARRISGRPGARYRRYARCGYRESMPAHLDQRVAPQLSLGLALTTEGKWEHAQAVLATVLASQPDTLVARHALVRCRLQSGDADAALEAARYPGLLDAKTAFADVLGEFAAAHAWPQHVELLRARALRHPQDYQVALVLAAALHRMGHPSDALPWCARAHALRPHELQPVEIRAAALVDRGDVENGLALYRDLLARVDDREMAARYLVLMHYDPAQENRGLFGSLQTFAQRHLRARFPPFVSSRGYDARRSLRIGWLSPRFNEGPVASFLSGLLGAFDRDRHRHLLIALQPARDATSSRLRALADEWFELTDLDDHSLLQRLRALELDVLVDLAGHSTANRLAVVAQRVAPVQVCWLDWFDTTAAPAMDAWISDAWLTPDGSTQRYSERVLRLPSGRFCYTPPHAAPESGRVGGDFVEFASFNRLAKLNAEVIATWAAILHRIPFSRLHLGHRLLDEPATRAHTIERFAAHGVSADRLLLHGHRPYADLLDAYRGIDIALDPFPFSGCTTTCDALFMGCPAITLPGQTFVSRQSASLLWRLGRDRWVARDREDYVERAVEMAANVAELRAQREALREAVRNSLCDAERHAREFAAALRKVCHGPAAPPDMNA